MFVAQVEFSEEQGARLQELAQEQSLSVPRYIQQLVAEKLVRPAEPTRAEKLRRTLEVVGKYRSGVPDLGQNHDKYLVEAYAGEHLG